MACLDGCILEKNLIVCPERETIETMNDLASDRDVEALEALAPLAVLAGCEVWERETYIYAEWEGILIPAEEAEVRKRGEPRRWWTSLYWIQGRE